MAGNLVARSLHDLSAGAWFGGSLMGAIGLNGGAAAAKDAAERTRLASVGWKKWQSFGLGALAVHAASGLAVIADNKGRLAWQHGVKRLTIYKTVVTLLGTGVTLYTAMVGRKVDQLASEGGQGVTEPKPGASEELQAAQKQLKILQWTVPAFAGWVMVMGAKEGEMQRPKNVAKGLARKLG